MFDIYHNTNIQEGVVRTQHPTRNINSIISSEFALDLFERVL